MRHQVCIAYVRTDCHAKNYHGIIAFLKYLAPCGNIHTEEGGILTKIVRVINARGQPQYGYLLANGMVSLLDGSIETGFVPTRQMKGNPQFFLPPVQTPAIICIGLNYRAHAAETGAKIPQHPVVFFKNPASIIGPDEAIHLPTHLPSTQVDYEGELAVVIGKRCKNASQNDALDYVLGYTIANDVSARDWQKQWGGSQWSRGKSFDTFCPVGPAIVSTSTGEFDPMNLKIRTLVSGQVMQESNTSDMIFSIPKIIEFLSGSTTLLPGTLILTGTPAGVGMGRNPPRWLAPGDTVEVEIEALGRLRNPVIAEPG